MTSSNIRAFHDAIIASFVVQSRQLKIRIEGVWVGDNLPRESGFLIVRSLGSLTEEGKEVSIDSGTYGLDDGQILALSQSDGSVELLVEWESYKPRFRRIVRYKMTGDGAEWCFGLHRLTLDECLPRATGHARTLYRRFRHPDNAHEIDFDTACAGEPAWGGRDHYHLVNVNARDSSDARLDANGNATPKGSLQSQILAGTTIRAPK